MTEQTTPKKKTGRPLANIDQMQFENLCKLQCTEKEICSWFNITDKTLTAWCKRTYKKSFSEIFHEKREAGKISLRRAQWQMAQTNPTMAIFLGKQYLNQKDVKDISVTKSTDETVKEMEAYFDAKARDFRPPMEQTD